jgi:membrane protein
MTWLAGRVGLDRAFVSLWAWLRVPVALALLTVALALAYHLLPDVAQPFHLLTPGAVLALLVWVAATIGFAAYVTTVAHYSATYGSLAAIVVLLLYFYVSSLALLLGAEVNGVLYQQAPRPRQGRERAQPTPWRRYLR